MTTSQSRILFRQLVTFNDEGAPDIFQQGEMLIEEGRVLEIKSSQSSGFEGKTLDWSDCLVLPGFVNAHCHLSLTGLAGKVKWNGDFIDWIRQVVEINRNQNEIAFPVAIKEGVRNLQRSGVTSLIDYLARPELLLLYKDLPFRQLILLETLGFHSARAPEIARFIREILEQQKFNGPFMKLGLAPHAPYSTSPDLYRALHSLVLEFNIPISSHVAEVEEEIELLSSGGGPFERFLKERGVWDESWKPPQKTPVAYLDDLGVLNDMQVVHLNFIDDADVNRLAQSRASAVFCPGSTQWFGRAPGMPVQALRSKGIPVGLGTDSLTSNNSLNFLEELRIAECLQPEVSRVDWLDCATRGGAQGLGMNCGQLAPGRWADAICFRMPEKNTHWPDAVFDPSVVEVDGMVIAGRVQSVGQSIEFE